MIKLTWTFNNVADIQTGCLQNAYLRALQLYQGARNSQGNEHTSNNTRLECFAFYAVCVVFKAKYEILTINTLLINFAVHSEGM